MRGYSNIFVIILFFLSYLNPCFAQWEKGTDKFILKIASAYFKNKNPDSRIDRIKLCNKRRRFDILLDPVDSNTKEELSRIFTDNKIQYLTYELSLSIRITLTYDQHFTLSSLFQLLEEFNFKANKDFEMIKKESDSLYLDFLSSELVAKPADAVEMKAAEPAKGLTAREFAAMLTLNDIELDIPWKGEREFYFRDAIRIACRFHGGDPWNHLLIRLHSWSKKIKLISPVKDEARLNEKVTSDPVGIRISNALEFETTINRLLPGFLNIAPEGYSVNFSESELKRACQRTVWDPDEENYRPKEYYYIEDPDSDLIY